jgi:creatinine amidohydrolase/Fe(II)-dependent formamide hydrolase-like protein
MSKPQLASHDQTIGEIMTLFRLFRANLAEVAQLLRSSSGAAFGNGYSLQHLSAALSNPQQVGMLPPLPFGWSGSLIPVSDAALISMVTNLLESLRDDGFTQVYALLPQGLNLKLGAQSITIPLSRKNPAGSFWDSSPKDRVLIAPIGHTEQHGHHLPLSTDTLIIDAIASGITAAVPDRALRLPVMPYGVSTHRASFAGTLNTGGRAFEDFWLEVIDQLVWRGFEHFYLISGHGGNSSFLVNIVKYAVTPPPCFLCNRLALPLWSGGHRLIRAAPPITNWRHGSCLRAGDITYPSTSP